MNVIVSHANVDKRLAEKVADEIRQSGFQVWDERDIQIGTDLSKGIHETFRQADAIVILLTPKTLSSPYFAQELEYALTNKAYKGRVIPVVAASAQELDPSDIPWILRKFNAIHAPDLHRDKNSLNKISQALVDISATT